MNALFTQDQRNRIVGAMFAVAVIGGIGSLALRAAVGVAIDVWRAFN